MFLDLLDGVSEFIFVLWNSHAVGGFDDVLLASEIDNDIISDSWRLFAQSSL